MPSQGTQTSGERRRRGVADSLWTTAFVLGYGGIIFVAARNSLTWYLERMWGASGNFWQSQWEKIHGWFGEEPDPYWMGLYGTGIWTVGVFWSFNILLLLLDYFERPAFLRQYKVQEDTHLDMKKLGKALVRIVFNQIVIGWFFMWVMVRAMVWRGCDFGRELPTFPWVLYELTIAVLVEEVAFYYSHRLVHHPLLYKHIHKIHHEWTAPIGVVALYAHPVEHVMSNYLPPLLGPLLCGCHIATAWLWFAIALISTTISHSGYHFPFLPSPEAHDFHHLKFNTNYGVLGVLDRLHGTDAKFRASKAYKRHFLSLSLVPLRQAIPEDDKSKSE